MFFLEIKLEGLLSIWLILFSITFLKILLDGLKEMAVVFSSGSSNVVLHCLK